jgi:adenylate kinase
MDEEFIKAVKRWLGSGSINIFGPPFAGKDTHGHRLADQLDAVLLGGGEILRGSGMPDEITALHRTGLLFPTDMYLRVVLPFLKQKKFAGKPLILSSVGRRQGEELGVLEATSAAGHPIQAAIYLNVDDATVWDRWEHSDSRKTRGSREDDSYEALKVRLSEFRNKTMPVIDFYRDQKLLLEIDSNQSKDDVSKAILTSLYKLALGKG